jgi:hypothetical protein
MAKFLLNGKNIPYNEKMMVEVGSLEGGLKSLEENDSDIFLWEKFTTEPFLKKHGLQCIGEVLTPWPPFSVASTKKFKKANEQLISEIVGHFEQIHRIFGLKRVAHFRLRHTDQYSR